MTEALQDLEDQRVLIVEDDRSLSELLTEEVREAGLQVQTARSTEEALARFHERPVDLIVSDLRLPGDSGMELLRETRKAHVPPAFIVITAFGSIPQAVEALQAGADDFLTKPLDLEHFMIALWRTLETRRLRKRVQAFEELLGEDHFHGMIGRCRPMQVLFDHVQQVARADGPVLIEGESGTGKELVARAVHAESARSDQPFLAVNCAGVPRDLLESEFFGHTEGAFTGARKKRTGLFQEASGGTLLLDEIAEMPPELQAKLLRVLQEGEVRPVGSTDTVDVDVRVLASTNRDMEEEVEEGSFRTDLFYRLETFTLRVPPLRERGEDIDLLAAHFLERFREKAGKDITGIAPEAIERLRSYRFPGNVRELENVMERAVTFCAGSQIEVEDLPSRVQEHQNGVPASDASSSLSPLLVEDEELPTLEEIEHRYIHYVLERTGGNKRKAADLLGIGRRTLYRKL